jgi:hypothetical protein
MKICFSSVSVEETKKGVNTLIISEYAFESVGTTGFEPVTPCIVHIIKGKNLSRSLPNWLNTVIIHDRIVSKIHLFKLG